MTHYRRWLVINAIFIFFACKAKSFTIAFTATRQHHGTPRLSLSKTCAQLAAVEPSSSYALQDICDKLVDGAGPGDLEQLLVAAGAAYFPQADTWAKAWSPMRCVVAHIPDKWCISALVLPSESLSPQNE